MRWDVNRMLGEIFAKMQFKWSTIIEVTNNCNLRCPFCYVIRESRLKPQNLSVAEFKNVLHRHHPLYLQMTGGEATTHPNFIELLKIGAKNSFIQQVSTNGVALNKFIPEIAKIFPVPIISISLDAPNKNHDLIRNFPGLFKRVMQNVILLRKNHIPVAFSMTVFGPNTASKFPQGNLGEVENMIKFCTRFQIPVNIQPASPADPATRIALGKILLKTKSHYVVNSMPFRKMLVTGNWFPCRFNWTHISIGSKGQPLSTTPQKCYFCGKCKDCYYSCVWEPTFLVSPYVIPTALNFLKQGVILNRK